MTDEELAELARLMVWGLDAPEEIDGVHVKADYPLDVRQASRWMGVRVKRARTALSDPRFKRAYSEACESLRNGQRARNLATAIAIRDEAGDGSAAASTARLKAIATIEGRDGGGVNVTVNHSTTNVAISPGYVIRLPAGEAAPALPAQAGDPLTIEARAIEEDEG